MAEIREAITGCAAGAEIAALELPSRFRATVTLRSDVERVSGVPQAERDPRDSLHVREVETPEIAPDECLIAVMASSINYNTIWSSTFLPIPTFNFLDRLGQRGGWEARHAQDFHVLGSDAAGVVLRTGALVRAWEPGDRVVVNSISLDTENPELQQDGMTAPGQLAWGYETNYGGLAELAVVKAHQLLPKATHLTWEESAGISACNGTAYRMLVSRHGANMRVGNSVLVWGATGGLGIFGTQTVQAAGGTVVGVVSSPQRAAILAELGVEHVIDRQAEDYQFWTDPTTQDEREWRRFRDRIRELSGRDPDIVFEHPGRETMGASMFVCQRGGTVVTCAATSGYNLNVDGRDMSRQLKRIVGSHMANYHEAHSANQLVLGGHISPALSALYDLEGVGDAALEVKQNTHEGKVGVLALAPSPGLGIEDPARRAAIGDRRVSRVATAIAAATGESVPRLHLSG